MNTSQWSQAPSFDQVRHARPADEVTLGVAGTSPGDNAERARRARQILAGQAAGEDRAYQQASWPQEPAAPQAPIAALIAAHDGDMVAAVSDQWFVTALRGRTGTTEYGQEVGEDHVWEWVDPLAQPADFRALHAAVDDARQAAGLPSLTEDEVMDAARMRPPDREILASQLWHEQVDSVMAGLERGEHPEALTRHAHDLIGDVPETVAFMRADAANARAFMRQAAAREVAACDAAAGHADRAGWDPAAALIAGDQDLRQRVADWRRMPPGRHATASIPGRDGAPSSRAARAARQLQDYAHGQDTDARHDRERGVSSEPGRSIRP